VLENTLRKIDQSEDTYFDDLTAKNAAIQATVEATKAGDMAKSFSSGQYLDSTVHHHHHTADGTTTVSTSDVTPIGTTIQNKEPEFKFVR
jgi:hypothetical protein